MVEPKVSKKTEEIIKDWLRDIHDEEMKKEIKQLIKEQPDEAENAFSTHLKFGTGGLRAKMGPGPGRMNKYTIQVVTQGLANYLLTFDKKLWGKGVVICHDCRIHSRDFAEEAAKVLAANHIPVHLVSDLRPTPFCSFCVRHFHAIAGINLTASHNPKEYNGYKVYWSDGAQVVPPHDTKIIDAIEKVTSINQVKTTDLESPLITIIDKNAEEAYYKALFDLTLTPERDHKQGKQVSIVYSPLNGAGETMIPEALDRSGFTNLSIVKEQEAADGSFPTTPYPNPETDEALKLGWRDLKEDQADILLVSDPDSDRLSCSLLHHGQPKRLTGNELGLLLLNFLIRHLKPEGKWATVTTIVSSPLIKEMTEKHGGTCFEVLTGFKYIGEKIHQWESQEDGYHFLFGMEESLGYLYGTHARDKDATIAALLTAELTLELKLEGKTLLNQLYHIYETYGVYREDQKVIESKQGLESLLKQMANLRQNLPKRFLNQEVISIEDYQLQTKLDCQSNKTSKLDLPKSNVLVFYLKDKSRFIIRPSGTEPKLKIYGQIHSPAKPNIEKTIDELDHKLKEMLSEVATTYFPGN